MSLPAVAATRGGPVDVRLVGLAVATWLTAYGALHTQAPVAFTLAAAALATVVGLWRWRYRAGGWVAVGLALLLGVACGSAATAARLVARDATAIAEPAAQRAEVTAVLSVRRDPLALAGTGQRPSWLVPARLHQLHRPGQPATDPARMRVRVLVLTGEPSWQSLQPGQRLRVTGRLAPARGGDLTAAVLSVNEAPELLGAPPGVYRVAGSMRTGLQRASEPLPAQPGGLVPGLAVGDVSQLDPGLSDDFFVTGLTHLIAVSGSHCTIITGFVYLLVRAARAPPWLIAVACGLAIIGYVILCQATPSVLRAAVMGAIALVALASGRLRAAVPALAAAVTVLVVADPQLAAAPGFTMSVLATAGLLLLAPRWRDGLRQRGVPPVLAEALAVPAAAQVAVSPVIAGMSGTISLVAVAANLIAAPVVVPATVFGVLAALVSPVAPAAAEFLAWLTSWPAWWLVWVARYGAQVPAAVVPWPAGPAGALLLTALTVGVLVAVRFRRVRVVLAVAAVALAVGALPVKTVASGWPPAGAVAVVCSVGQGDLVVIPVQPGAAVVVDAGPEPAAADRCLRDLRVRQIPLLIVSHYHADHVGGLAGVVRGREVAAMLVPGWPEPVAGRELAAAALAPLSAPMLVPEPGAVYHVGAATLRMLGPPRELVGTRSDPNNNSLVIRVELRGASVLLTGDAESELQEALLATVPAVQLRADVLKVAHHGSGFQTAAFLAAVSPAVALVPVGADNPYGHPHPAVLGALAERGARVLRTDLDGDIAAVVPAPGELAVVTRPLPPGTGARRVGPVRDRTRGRRPVNRRTPGTAVDRPPGRPPCDDSRVVAPADPVVLILGEEQLLAARAATEAVAVARLADPAVEVQELTAGATSPGELAEALSPSLFGGPRVIIVQAGQDARKDLATALLAYAKAPDPQVRLIVNHAGGAKGRALADGLRKAGASVIAAGKITRHRERVEFIRSEVRRLGGRCGEDAAEALLAAVGSDLRELAAACSQLVADTGGRIEPDTVARYYRGRAEVSGFTVADAVMIGDAAAALTALRWALQVGVPVVPIADALADGVRTVSRVASAGRGNPHQLASRLGMPPWKVERGQRQARGWQPEGLVEAMRVAAECNAAVKGGSEDSGYALERAVLAMTSARGGAR